MTLKLLSMIGCMIIILGGYSLFRDEVDGRDTNTTNISREKAPQGSIFSEKVFPWLVEHKLTRFTALSDFRPEDSITRGEAAKFFSKYGDLLGLEKTRDNCRFTDTSRYDEALSTHIVRSCEYELMRGSNGKFDPNNTITEAQAMAVVIRSLDGMLEEKITPWYRNYYDRARELSIITDETLLDIDRAPITRGKLATWLYRAYYSAATEDLIVYETEVDGPADCSSYEKYDSVRQICSFECRDEIECKNIQTEIDKELDSWSEELADADRDAPTGDEEEKNILVSYRVDTGEKISKISGSDASEHQTLWREISDLSPDTLSDRYIETFDVYSDNESDVLAFVVDDDGNGKWKIAVNLPTHKLSDEKGQKATLIHELAHIITLNKDQFMNPNGACRNYETEEGCTRESSYLHTFVKKYWGTAKEIPYNKEKFVSEYASSNPEEDIAESFAFYVLGRNFSEINTRESKMNFFTGYPELISMRESMRNVIASEIIRVKKLKK